ncbi:amino acid permease [Lactobacillus sp. 3B(2020)]|uniref:amino acid permease n=1 Tax=Lactobacillus sp. 3B(2020) TaxID=2695882 RepID=UPI0015DD7186|nr:amino acid permease [Lactobacillus sp. 3B(2020)]QLL70623.1 amino acid permease [Lactobacillus sp. 3B(2020)]
MSNSAENDLANQHYNQLTGLKLFAMTSSMVISIDEFAPFGKTGATALFHLLLAGLIWFLPVTQAAGEMASIDGWQKGGIFTWVKNTLGEKAGFTAMFYQWIHITAGMDLMMYVIIGALSIALNTPWFNTTPIIRFGLMMILLWGATFSQLLGAKRVGKIAEWLFALGIVTPVLLLVLVVAVYLIQGNPVYVHINFHTIFPHHVNGSTLVAFVPFILAFCGGEASAPHVKNLAKPKQYPKVMVALVITAISLDLLGSMSIAMTVPAAHIQNSTGFVHTYGRLLSSIGLPGNELEKIIGLMLACGILGELGNWIAGPNQGLYEAAREGFLPGFFAKATKHGIPFRIMVLQSSIVTLTALLITFTSGQNADFAFNVALAATTAQYLMVYMIMLWAYIILKLRHEDLHRAYRMTQRPNLSIAFACLAFVITFVAFFITFIPAQGTPQHLRVTYVVILALMCLIVSVLPFWIYRGHQKWQRELQ